MTNRTNDKWMEDLRAGGDQQAHALDDLRTVILRALPYVIAGRIPPIGPETEALVEEVVQETLIRVLDHLHKFEGQSQFTTWVYKYVVRATLTRLRHRSWQDVPLLEFQPASEDRVEREDIVERVNRIIMQELTENQRGALIAIAIQGIPLEEAAQKLGTNRDTLCTSMHEARLKLKNRLHKEGLAPQQILSSFD